MVKMISRLTGSLMFVADDRVEEYLERGHSLLSPPIKRTEREGEKTAKAKKATIKKATTKKKG